jgi:hypothetical protein
MINSLDEAVRYFKTKCLENKSVYYRSYPGRNGTIAYRIIDQRIPEHPISYMVFFKRETFHTFGRIYPQTFHKGEGQTVNLSILNIAAENNDIIAVVMPNESVWVCPADVWLSYVRNKNTIRTPSTEIGEEASIPDSMLLSWYQSSHAQMRSEQEYLTDRERWEKHIDEYTQGKNKKNRSTLDEFF